MYYKKTLILSLIFFLSLIAKAQSISDLWLSMPMQMTPYLTDKQKLELIEYNKNSGKNKVVNKLHGLTSLDSLSTNYGHILLSGSKELYLYLLPYNDNEKIILSIESYKVPEVYSVINFYNLKWDHLTLEEVLPKFSIDDFVMRPDTMCIDVYNNLISLISPNLINYSYDNDLEQLNVTISLSLLSKEDKNRVFPLIVEKKLKWNGKTFN